MAKRVGRDVVLRNAYTGDAGMLLNREDRAAVRDMVMNASLMRSSLLNKLIDPRRDIDDECGYPKELTPEQYKLMYDREGIATRVVSIFSDESWAVDPEIREDEGADETEFEAAFKKVEKQFQIWSYLNKVDEISGIGRFGILLLGIDDGKELHEPVEGIDETGKASGSASHQLLFLRAFDESQATIQAVETDRGNPRYGKPTYYSVSFENVTSSFSPSGEASSSTGKQTKVHWSRVIHIADNRRSSEVYGIPRMQVLFNRLYDIRKIAGGSGEMFWKGGFPGISFEMDPNARALTETQTDAVKEQLVAYANGLQRYLMIQGITAKSLPPQVSDPKSHIEVQLELIAIAMGVPKRIFMGSEQAKLASAQDSVSWNKRVKRRQEKYLSPYVIYPTIERMMALGILPMVEEWEIYWPDLEAPSEMDRADVLAKLVEAFSKYVAGGVDALIPPKVFLSMFAGLEPDQVEEIEKASQERIHEEEIVEPEPEPEPEPAPVKNKRGKSK